MKVGDLNSIGYGGGSVESVTALVLSTRHVHRRLTLASYTHNCYLVRSGATASIEVQCPLRHLHDAREAARHSLDRRDDDYREAANAT